MNLTECVSTLTKVLTSRSIPTQVTHRLDDRLGIAVSNEASRSTRTQPLDI